MVEHLQLTAALCLAVHLVLRWPEMIGENLGRFLLERLPPLLSRPLFDCLPCMGFWYSLGLWFALGYNINRQMLITAVAAIGANALLALFVRLIEAVENLERFTDETEP